MIIPTCIIQIEIPYTNRNDINDISQKKNHNKRMYALLYILTSTYNISKCIFLECQKKQQNSSITTLKEVYIIKANFY